MTREEQETLEKAVSRAVASTIDAKLGQFYIDREQHWEDHKFISDLRKMFDMSRAEMCRSVVKWIVAVVIGLIIAGWAFAKGVFRISP